MLFVYDGKSISRSCLSFAGAGCKTKVNKYGRTSQRKQNNLEAQIRSNVYNNYYQYNINIPQKYSV